jgi:hypothetical protein
MDINISYINTKHDVLLLTCSLHLFAQSTKHLIKVSDAVNFTVPRFRRPYSTKIYLDV